MVLKTYQKEIVGWRYIGNDTVHKQRNEIKNHKIERNVFAARERKIKTIKSGKRPSCSKLSVYYSLSNNTS